MTRRSRLLLGLAASSGAASASAGTPAAPEIPPTQSQQSTIRRRASHILDSETVYKPSTESNFDHMLTLLPADGPIKLNFYWNDPEQSTGEFEGRLVHRAPSADIDAGWLGFGVYDVPAKGKPTEFKDIMVGSQAIIGNVASKEVAKYNLAGKTLGSGGVEKMDASFQTLVPTATSIVQHEGDDGHVSTVLTFKKVLKEADDTEIEIYEKGHNAFLYAVGPPAPEGEHHDQLGFHILKGAFVLDFDLIKQKASGKEAGATAIVTGGGDSAASSDNLCKSDDPAYRHSASIGDGLTLQYQLTFDSLTVKLTYDGLGWLGLGTSPDGNMIGSEVVIGRPDLAMADGEPPLKYHISGKSASGVAAMGQDQQTLQDASIVEQGGKTVMTYTKRLQEPDELVIPAEGPINFVYAVGSSNTLAYHMSKGTFTIDLGRCELGGTGSGSGGSGGGSGGGSSTPSINSASDDQASSASDTKPAPTEGSGQLTKTALWIAHGAVATLAWALFTPAAVTTAWFRTLVPSSWIYVHVFSNVASFAFTALAVVIAVVTISLGGGGIGSHFSDMHHFTGVGMLVLATFQVGNGFLRPPVEKRDPYADEPSGPIPCPGTAREWWKIGHRVLGTCLLIVGFWQITTGLDLYAQGRGTTSWKPYFMYYFIAFAAVIVLLRIWMWWEERRARRTVDMMGDGGEHMGGHGHYGDDGGSHHEGVMS